MAISRSGASDVWVELANSTPTSVATVTFSSLPQYKKYKIVAFNCKLSNVNAIVSVRFNNDANTKYAFAYLTGASSDSNGATTSLRFLKGDASNTSPYSGHMVIDNADETTKEIISFSAAPSSNLLWGSGIFNSDAIINRIDLILSSTYTFASDNTGPVIVYGSN